MVEDLIEEKKPDSKWNSTRLLIVVLCILYIVWVTWLSAEKDWPDVVIAALYAIAAIGGGYIGLNTLRPSSNIGGMVGNITSGAVNIINNTKYRKSIAPGFEDQSDPKEIPL